MKRKFLLSIVALAIAPQAFAQAGDYPNRAVKVIVPFVAGGGADLIARYAAKQLEDQLGQAFVVDNRGGANGAIGMAAVKNSPADGYTLVLGSSGTMAINPIYMKDLGYDSVNDFKPVAGLTRTHGIWVVPPDSKFRTVADMVNAAKANPGKVNVGTYTSSYALLVEWFNRTAGLKLANVPYKTPGQAQVDLMGGRLDALVLDISAALPLMQSGKMRGLATVGAERAAVYPGMPTFAESGYPAYVSYLWNGFYVRSDTPAAVVGRLAEALQRITTGAAFAEHSRTAGIEPLQLGPDAMRRFHLNDLEKLRAVADAAGIKPE